MVGAPWEPYPERERKLERRARKPRNKHNTRKLNRHASTNPGSRKKQNRHHGHHPATDSSFSSTSSTEHHAREGVGGAAGRYDTDSVVSSCDNTGLGSLKSDNSLARVRPDDCWCLRDGGCHDEDGCCVEDLPGEVVCPCFSRISSVVVVEVTKRCFTGTGIL